MPPKGGGRRGGISRGAMNRATRRADEDERRAKKWQQQQQREQQVRGLGQAAASQTFGWGFGNGENGGDRNWQPPVHGMTEDGTDVTASFGQGPRANETLITRGHVPEMETFYGTRGDKGHDHFGAHGESYGDRGKSA